MLTRPLFAFAFAAIVGLFWAAPADASSRFTVTNKTDHLVKVVSYSGTDTVCMFEEKTKTVPKGKSRSFGCKGRGNQRCKIKLKQYGDQVCKINKTTCGLEAIVIPNKMDLILSKNKDDVVVCRGKMPPEKTDSASTQSQP